MIGMSGKRWWFARIGRAGGMAFAVLAAVGMVAVQTARAEPGPSAVFHGRTDARVRFTGDWMPVVAPDKTLGRYAERSDAKGASVELDFCGTSVGLVHQAGGLGWEWGVILPETGRALGLAEVRVDDGAPVVIDTRRGGRTLLAKGLPASRHRVTVSQSECGDHAVVRNRESKSNAVPFRVFVFVVATFDPDSDPDLDETVKP